MRKLTIEFVKGKVEETGERLISKRYENAHSKLEFQCLEGHHYKMTWAHFQQGKRCAECGGTKKLTIEYVRDYASKTDEILISKRYKNSKTKLAFQCPQGHRYKAIWNSFQQGQRCAECAGKKKLTIEHIREEIEKDGTILISKRYKNSGIKLKFQCPQGHRYKAIWSSFQKGYRCSECAGLKKLTIERIREEIEKDGVILISKRYKNARAKLEFQCSQGHRYKMTWHNFQGGHRCAECAKHGFQLNKPAILYYIEVLHRGRYYYKIGITNRTVATRYSKSDQKKISILAEWDYKRGKDCRDEERRILEDFANWRYRGKAKILEGVGNTEIFTENVLHL